MRLSDIRALPVLMILVTLLYGSTGVFASRRAPLSSDDALDASWLRAGDEAEGWGILVIAHGSTGHGHHPGPRPIAGDDQSPGHPPHHPPHPPHPPGQGAWEETAKAMVEHASHSIPFPVELVFGMWDRDSFQGGIDRLVARGARKIRVVPLFVNSNSIVIYAQRYIFSLIPNNPLARMGIDPGRVVFPPTMEGLWYGSAMDRSQEISDVLIANVGKASQQPAAEELILVAHGPITEEDNQKWLADLGVHLDRIKQHYTFAASHVVSLQDDEPTQRAKAIERLKGILTHAHHQGRTPVIIPVLIARGGIEIRLLEDLKGHHFVFGDTLAPHAKISDWIVREALDLGKESATRSRP